MVRRIDKRVESFTEQPIRIAAELVNIENQSYIRNENQSFQAIRKFIEVQDDSGSHYERSAADSR